MTRGHLRLVSPSGTDGARINHDVALRVLLVENHLRIRQGLAAILNACPGVSVAEERVDPAVILDRIRGWHPDVVSLAVQLEGAGGLELLDRVREEWPDAAVVVLTMQRSAAFAHRVLRRGASGVVLKDHADSELLPAVEAAVAGETYVSPRIALG